MQNKRYERRKKEKYRKQVEHDIEEVRNIKQKLGVVETKPEEVAVEGQQEPTAYRLKDDEVLRAATAVWNAHYKGGNAFLSIKDMGMQLLQGYRELFVLSDGSEYSGIMFVDRIDNWSGTARINVFLMRDENDSTMKLSDAVNAGLAACADILGLRKVYCEVEVDDIAKETYETIGFTTEGTLLNAGKADSRPPVLTDLLILGKEIL